MYDKLNIYAKKFRVIGTLRESSGNKAERVRRYAAVTSLLANFTLLYVHKMR